MKKPEKIERNEIKAAELSQIKESSPAPLEEIEYIRFLESISTYQNDPLHAEPQTIVRGTEMRLSACPGWIDVVAGLKRGELEIIKYPKGKLVKLLVTLQHQDNDKAVVFTAGTTWAYEQVPDWVDIDSLKKAGLLEILEY